MTLLYLGGWALALALLVCAFASIMAFFRMTRWLESCEKMEDALRDLSGHPMGINALQCAAYEMSASKGWHDEVVPPEMEKWRLGTRLMLMVSEIAEALEAMRDGMSVEDTIVRDDGKPEGIPSELADVVIRVLDFCGAYGIPLERTILQKMAYNSTRPHRHGGKAL